MGIKEYLEGIIARTTSIRIDFRWKDRRFRERVALRPTAANMRAAARMHSEILQAIDLGVFTWDDFARYFPESPAFQSKRRPETSRSTR
jgi:integrase